MQIVIYKFISAHYNCNVYLYRCRTFEENQPFEIRRFAITAVPDGDQLILGIFIWTMLQIRV